MKRRDLIQYLLQHGCKLIGEGAKHSWWDTRSKRTAIPRHTEISDFLARKICKDLGLDPPP